MKSNEKVLKLICTSRARRGAERARRGAERAQARSGKLSAGDVQIGGASGQDSGAQGVQAFTKAGASGKHPGNMHRDMMREVLKGTSLPEPYYAEAHITYVT